MPARVCLRPRRVCLHPRRGVGVGVLRWGNYKWDINSNLNRGFFNVRVNYSTAFTADYRARWATLPVDKLEKFFIFLDHPSKYLPR